MIQMKKKTLFTLNIGLPSIFLVFIVICLLSFSVLSYVSAKADWNLCEKALEHSDAYYQAANEAEKSIRDYAMGNTSQSDFYFPISDLQTLYVSLSHTDNDNYKITDWKIISTDNVSYDEHLHVIP